MIKVGKVDTYIVVSRNDSGFILNNLVSSEHEVLMPFKKASKGTKVDQKIKAFVYEDTKKRLVATETIPNAAVGEYALMRVIDVQEFGAFFEWGISKDLLVPGNEQKIKVKKHEFYVVRVCLEEGTNRIYGTTKLGKYIEESVFDVIEGDTVEIVPVQKTELGYRCVVNRIYIGMIYHNEIFSEIQIDKNYAGVVKKLREDGLVDLALQVQGIKNLDNAKEKVLEMLLENDGESHLHDKSSPDEIKRELGMSKQTFKKAIGMLYRDRKIVISKEGIKIVK